MADGTIHTRRSLKDLPREEIHRLVEELNTDMSVLLDLMKVAYNTVDDIRLEPTGLETISMVQAILIASQRIAEDAGRKANAVI